MPSRVLLLRGHHPSVWGLRPFESIPERFSVRVAVTRGKRWSLQGLGLEQVPVRTLRDRIPLATLGTLATLALPDRVLGADALYAEQDIIHAEELSLWFTAQAARLKTRGGYRLVVTVWETLPLLDAFRTPHARRFRAATLAATDLFLAATERARDGLLLEGVPQEKILLAYPGVDVERFSVAPDQDVGEHVIVSVGRLEWEKGHHDVLRAIAALKRGIVQAPPEAVRRLRAVLVGSGPEEQRLRAHAAELGIGDAVSIESVHYDHMPAMYARASALVLASLPRSGCSLHPADIPRCFWEEQFGLVLAEAMAAGLPMIVSTSGAIPEIAGEQAVQIAPGDPVAIARALADGPLARPPGARVRYAPERLQRFSIASAAERLGAAYDRALAGA
jgi:glycosyltransferase involved in cell wall biosynthesis